MGTSHGQTAQPGARPETPTVEASGDAPAWDDYLAARDDAGLFHDPRWGRILADVYGARPVYLTARRGEAIVGVLPLVYQRSVLFGRHLCSIPYFDAAGVLADDEAAEAALLDAAHQARADCGAESVELRQLAPLGEGLPVRTDKVTMWLELGETADQTWDNLKTKVRTKVRKALKKAEVDVVSGGGELLDEYCAVYSRTMRDLGSPPHGKRLFRRILDAFGDAVRLFVARSQDGQPLAASFTLTDRWGFHVPWSGSDFRFRRLGANRVLYWHMLAEASDAGAGRFDFGRSTRDSGTYEFKAEWAAEPVQLYWHFLLPKGAEMPDLRPDSPKYRFLVATWRKLPLWLARALGPGIIGKLS